MMNNNICSYRVEVCDSEEITEMQRRSKGAATRCDSPALSLPIALYMGQSQRVTCRSNVPDT